MSVIVQDNIIYVTVAESPSNQVQVRSPGPQGGQGPAGTITVGTVTPLLTGVPPTVVNVGTPQNSVLNFGLPAGPAGPGFPAGGLTGQSLKKKTNADYDTEWGVGFDDTTYARSGFSARFGAAFSSTNLGDTLDKIILITYAGPLVSLSAAGSGTLREKGTPVTSVALAATTTKRSNAIAAVRFYYQGSLINTVASPNVNGGTENYTWTGSFADNVTFSAQVDDVSGGGGPTTSSSSASFTYVYPYFVGAITPGLTGSALVTAIQGQTKLVIASTASLNRSITATNGQVFVIAYPASYGALTSILDVNGFEVFGSFTGSTANFVGLDTTSQSYRIYQLNNPVVAQTTSFTFRR